MNVFQAEEGSKMTKKAIRDRVEKSLRLTVASYDEEENMAGVPADMRALMVENLDLSTDPERREWINKCIVLLFQENVQKRMMKK